MSASMYFVSIVFIPPEPFRGIVEETPNTTEHGRPSVMLEKYASATKMQPQSSGSLRSNAGIEKGKEIAARLNIHRIHSQLRGLDSTGQIWIKAPVFLLLMLGVWFRDARQKTRGRAGGGRAIDAETLFRGDKDGQDQERGH